jgi:hypothetical protein
MRLAFYSAVFTYNGVFTQLSALNHKYDEIIASENRTTVKRKPHLV